MLSKEMYSVLSCFPRKLGKAIAYETLLSLCEKNEDEIIGCLNETLYESWNFVRSSDGWRQGSKLLLTESGLSKIEEYERIELNQKITKRTLIISIIAMITSFSGVVVAMISLIM